MSPAQEPQHSPEDDLTRTLARQADRFASSGGASLDLEQVLSRAGEIRRGRRMRATIVMAAVVAAIAVPVGITTLGEGSDGPPVGPATSSPSVTRQPTTSDRSPVGLGDLRTGAAPRNGYAFDHVLHHGSTTIPLDPDWVISSIARIDGGFLVAHHTTQNGGITDSFVADDQNGTDQTWQSDGSGFAVSRGGNVGAFVDHTGTVVAVQDGGTRYFEVGTLPPSVGATATAVDGENCSGRSEETSCTVYVEVSFEGAHPSTETWAVSPNVAAKRVFAGLTHLVGVTPEGNVAGEVSTSDEGSCWEVRRPDNGTVWKTCRNSFDAFSPDGRYLLGGPPFRDGPGGGGLTILDARTGAVVLDLKTADNSFVAGARWEGPDHVVAAIYDRGKFAVERFALDGSREYATATAADTDDSYVSPFDLG